jgi:hypothetical protein
MPKPVFMKRGMYIVPHDAVLAVYIINSSHQQEKHYSNTNRKKKGKVVPLLNLIKHYAMKAYGGVDV